MGAGQPGHDVVAPCRDAVPKSNGTHFIRELRTAACRLAASTCVGSSWRWPLLRFPSASSPINTAAAHRGVGVAALD
eukprot:10318863-Alexandrium_andersonii.AAC.1